MDPAPGRRPLGQRGPTAELDIVGMGGHGQRHRRHGQVDAYSPCQGRSPTGRTSFVRPCASFVHRVSEPDGRDELGRDVGRDVDVPGQVGFPHHPQGQTQTFGLGPVPGEGAGTVGETEAGAGRDADHVGPVVAPVGYERHPVETGQPGQPVGHGEIGVGHHDLARPQRGQSSHPRLHGPVQPPSRFGQGHGPVLGGPSSHLGVVADDGDGKGSGRLEHPGGHQP